MDTPNRYFNGWRWQQWKADYSEADIKPCLEYFSKQFAAITDKEQGAYCTVFRLHMDPCWTNDPTKKAENEADISAFNMARYRLYLQKLYIPLIKDAIAHGLYVIVRPPGVCPQDISVADRYSRYLKVIGSKGLPYRLQVAVVLVAYANIARTYTRWTHDDVESVGDGILN